MPFSSTISLFQLVAAGAAAVTILMTVLWAVSLKLRDASIVDRVWGLNFIVLCLAYSSLTPELYWRNALVLILVSIWGLRLSLHIHVRNRGKPEDYRYQEMRKSHGESFWWQSFFRVFLLQGALSVLISAPLAWIFYRTVESNFSVLDGIGLAAWMVGFYFEAVGDWQLARFKSDPNNKGKLLTSGLWSLSRHPNYFGDALQWWGFFIFALASGGGYGTVIGPIVMTFFLRYVSGVTLLEGSLKVSKPGYEAYMDYTPAFIPKSPLVNLIRFITISFGKILANLLYRFDVKKIGPWPAQPWKDVRVMILLNHTSLMEGLLGSQMPYSYLWTLATRGNIPGADSTLKRPIVGAILKFIAPKVIGITRKYDESWTRFLDSIQPRDTLIFMPEGRMKRPTGLDKYGNKMTVKRGVVDVLLKLKTGSMFFLYSGGLHHVQAPGQAIPKIFKTISVGFEVILIEDYLASFSQHGVPPTLEDLQTRVIADLECRRDLHCV